MQNEGSSSSSLDSLIYSNICKAEEWCSMGQRPIVGVQLFYYGMGRVATQVIDTQGNRSFGDGECGKVVLSTELLPVVSVEIGCKDTPFCVVSYGSADKGMLVSLKLSLVANSDVCSKIVLTFFPLSMFGAYYEQPNVRPFSDEFHPV